jgi:CRISPR-associated protein Csm2
MPAQDMNTVLQRLQSLQRLSDLPLKDFAPEGGMADIVASQLHHDLKAAQLRKFYGLLKRVDLELRGQDEDSAFPKELQHRVLRILPLLAYAKGRNNIPENFYKFMKLVLDIDKIQTVRDYRTLIYLLEAVVAYHKFRGGKE